MRKIQKVICREELKSRIPGLFAYIEENDAGEFVLHKATDSLNGCYGKIIESIALPVSLTIDGNDLLKAGETYSYRTIMNYYYQYKDELEDSNSFKSFILNGIGKVEVFNAIELKENEHDLAPHYVYLATARNLFNQYAKLKIIYDNYTGGNDDFDVNKLESDICCICLKYRRMGGTKMYNKLSELMDKAETEADKYFGYAQENKLTLNLNVNLCQSIHDIGYLSCYLNDWVGGDKHFKGEFYTYNGNTYICKEDNTDTYDNDLMKFVFDPKYFQLVSEANSTKSVTSKDPNGVRFDLSAVSYNLTGSADSKLKSLRKYKEYLNGEDEEERPDSSEDWLYYYRKGLVINYTIINDDLGNIVSNSGLLLYDKKIATADVNDLAAYGNAITNITYDKDAFTITFEYIINAHLKAKSHTTSTDDDGNVLHKFDGFYVDDTDIYHGVKYKETYNYEEGSELDNLINGRISGVSFTQYIGPENDEKYSDFNKYAFSVIDSTVYYDKRLDTQIVSIPYVSSDYDTIVKNELDYMYADIFKTDYLEGITYEPKVENDVYINRGNYAAFERHIKLSEIKTLDDMINYNNTSFFNVQKVN